jgi:uncharacterized protein YjiS (DUF1127 family)
MRTTVGTLGLRQPAASTQGIIRLCRLLLRAGLERHQRRKAEDVLRGLCDRELGDTGLTRGGVDHVASRRSLERQHRTADWYRFTVILVLSIGTALVLALPDDANAQCSARDVLRNQLAIKAAPPPGGVHGPFASVDDVPAWKTIAIGTFKDSFALRNAMNAMGCGVGNSVDEVLARPAFTVLGGKTNLALVTVSAAELGLPGEAISLRDIYARAQRLGLQLAPAEVGPQLRIQYLDQPIGEFLTVAMEPIKTWSGEPVILTVVNGGAGLILIGQDGHDEAEIPATSRFVFVRPDTSMPAQSAALVGH